MERFQRDLEVAYENLAIARANGWNLVEEIIAEEIEMREAELRDNVAEEDLVDV